MKQDIVEYMVDSFTDFNGVERKIVACALSQHLEPSEDGYAFCAGWSDLNGFIDTEDPDFSTLYKVITVGIAICNPTDQYDEEVGKKTAYNKAMHDPKCPTIYTKDKGVASKMLIDAFLKQEIAFTKENPERIIKGYNQKKERFDKKEAIKKEIKELTESERQVVNFVREGVDVVKCAELVKKAKEANVSFNE